MLTSAVQCSVLCCLGVRSLRHWLAAAVACNHCSNQIVEPGSSSGAGRACGEKSSPELHLSFRFAVNSGTSYWSATFTPALTIKTANFKCISKQLNRNLAIPKTYHFLAKTKPKHLWRHVTRLMSLSLWFDGRLLHHNGHILSDDMCKTSFWFHRRTCWVCD